VLSWVLIWSTMFALWHLFVGKTGLDVALFAALGSSIGTLAAYIVFRQHLAPARANAGNVVQAWRLPKLIVTGTWEILAVLARQLFKGEPAESLILTVPFDSGGDDESAFRRALAIAYTTATPNFVVIDIDQARHLLVFHQIKKSEIPEMLQRLGARP
jgi:multisubunit Na+/H+ antiporter MnhE subunit